MKSEKTKNIIISILVVIIIIILTIMILMLTGVIDLNSKDNEISNNNKSEEIIDKKDNSSTPEELVEKKDWTEYLLSMHILEAKVKRIRYKEFGAERDQNETKVIDLAQLKELLSKLKDSELKMVYSLGMGGSGDGDYLEVMYEKDDNKYIFNVKKGLIFLDENDKDIVAFFNDKNYDVEHSEYKGEDGSFYFYRIENYNESIYDNYFE